MLVATAIVIAATILFLLVYMLAQKPVTTAQQLIQQRRYEEAANHPTADPLHQAEALKLLGRYDDAIAAYKRSDDPAAREGIALSLAHLGRDLDEAQRIMENQIALYPQIQEFQALGLAYILLRAGKRDEALRIYRDNVELIETRFRDDYTDADPLLAETLMMYAELEEAAGGSRAEELRAKAKIWSAAAMPPL